MAHIPAAAAISRLRRGLVRVLLKPGTGLPARKWAHITRTPPGAVAAWLFPGPPDVIARGWG